MNASETEIVERVRSVIAKHHKPALPEFTPEMTLEELGLDSFDAINITFALEEEFGIEIPGEGLRDVKTVGDVVNMLREALTQVNVTQ